MTTDICNANGGGLFILGVLIGLTIALCIVLLNRWVKT